MLWDYGKWIIIAHDAGVYIIPVTEDQETEEDDCSDGNC